VDKDGQGDVAGRLVCRAAAKVKTMSKLAEIIKLGIAPGCNTKAIDPSLPEKAVPRAFKELEQTQGSSKISRDSGFSVKAIKRIWNMLTFLTALLATTANAGDLTRSITFSDGQRITAAQLHTLVDGASIGATFLTGKNLNSTVEAADYVLVYDTSAGVYTKMTLSTLLMANTGLITTQTDDPNPAYNDYVLTYDASASSFAKVSITNLIYNTNLIAVLPSITNLTQSATMWVRHSGTNAQIEVTNLWLNFTYRAPFTNLAQHTAPTNTDRLLIWDSTAGTNKYTTLSGFFTNLTATTTNGASDYYITITNGTPKLITYANMVNTFSNSIFGGSFTSPNTNLNGLVAGKYLDVPHGLQSTPKIVKGVIACTSADAGYAPGDEVDFQGVFDPSTPASTDHRGSFAITAVANSTNVFVIQGASSLFFVRSKTTGQGVDIDETKWVYRVYARTQ
jgi:hypothetical protein